MSQAELEGVLIACIVVPLAFALVMAVLGRLVRARRILSIAYAVVAAPLNLVLLNGFLSDAGNVSVGNFNLTGLTFPFFTVINLLAVAAVPYAAFRSTEDRRPHLVLASLPAAAGLASLVVMAEGVMAFLFLWEGVSVAALVGLVSQGRFSVRRRLKAFLPWLIGDVLLLVGVVLQRLWFDEAVAVMRGPLTRGGEAQVVIVMILFLLSALLRLGLFPFGFWIRDLFGCSDPAWSAFQLGTVNFLLAGFRLALVTTMIARLVASDWGLVLVILGMLSVLAGPAIALRAADLRGFIGGMYTFQAGFVLVGLGAYGRAALEGALFLLLVSPLFLTASMMAGGTVLDTVGRSRSFPKKVSAAVAPASLVALAVSGMALVGLPPLDGFVGKALVSLGCFDKSLVSAFYGLVVALVMASVAVAAIAAVRIIGRSYGPEAVRDSGPLAKQVPVESAAPLLLCGGSLLLGVFPGVIIRNLVSGISRFLFETGFRGPAVVFRGTSTVVSAATARYLTWSQASSAFVLCLALVLVALYLANRAAVPSCGSEARFRPYLGGARAKRAVQAEFRVPTTGLLRTGFYYSRTREKPSESGRSADEG